MTYAGSMQVPYTHSAPELSPKRQPDRSGNTTVVSASPKPKEYMIATSRRLKRVRPDRRPVFVCDACSEGIRDKRYLRLVRSKDTLPEDSTVFKVHKACVSELTAENPEGWDEYALDSAEAKWLLPLSE